MRVKPRSLASIGPVTVLTVGMRISSVLGRVHVVPANHIESRGERFIAVQLAKDPRLNNRDDYRLKPIV